MAGLIKFSSAIGNFSFPEMILGTRCLLSVSWFPWYFLFQDLIFNRWATREVTRTFCSWWQLSSFVSVILWIVVGLEENKNFSRKQNKDWFDLKTLFSTRLDWCHQYDLAPRLRTPRSLFTRAKGLCSYYQLVK